MKCLAKCADSYLLLFHPLFTCTAVAGWYCVIYVPVDCSVTATSRNAAVLKDGMRSSSCNQLLYCTIQPELLATFMFFSSAYFLSFILFFWSPCLYAQSITPWRNEKTLIKRRDGKMTRVGTWKRIIADSFSPSI